MTAPLPSSTSAPQLSQTSTVFLAIDEMVAEKAKEIRRRPVLDEYAMTEAGSGAPAPRHPGRHRGRRRRANAGDGNPRAFVLRDTGRSPQARRTTHGRRQAY